MPDYEFSILVTNIAPRDALKLLEKFQSAAEKRGDEVSATYARVSRNEEGDFIPFEEEENYASKFRRVASAAMPELKEEFEKLPDDVMYSDWEKTDIAKYLSLEVGLLIEGFSWSNSPQGFNFWNVEHNKRLR